MVTKCTCSSVLKLEARFVEVKGPRDTLMARQEAWLQVIGEAAANVNSTCGVEVCHVEERTWEEPSKKKRKKTVKATR